MNKDNYSRTKATSKNMLFGVAGKFATLILSFVLRTTFISFLGKELLGVNSLYTEILNMLSIAELGFGTAFAFAMYKPIAESDNKKIIQLINLFKRIYYIVALVVFVIGMLLVPFLDYIVKGADSLNSGDLKIYFIFFLLNTVINYLVQYKIMYVNAKMQSYVVTNIETIINFVLVSVQCLTLILFKNYLVYLIAHTLLLLLSRIIVAVYLNKKYPILKDTEAENLPMEDKKELFAEVKGLALQNFSSVAIHSTDNLIISMVSGLGVIGVGLVSNYNLIITSVTAFIVIMMTALTPGFGNLVASSTQKHFRECFEEVNFYGFWIYGFCSIAFFVLVPPFISLWLGSDYLIDNGPFLLIVMNVFFQGQSLVYNNARNAKGNFNLDKWVSVFQAIINLVISIVCAYLWGLLGVYIGTIVSRLFFVIARPIRTYKYLYGVSCVNYFRKLIIYSFITFFAGLITYCIAFFALGKEVTIAKFAFECLIVLVVPNAIFLLMFFRSRYIKSFIGRLKEVFKKNERNS